MQQLAAARREPDLAFAFGLDELSDEDQLVHDLLLEHTIRLTVF